MRLNPEDWDALSRERADHLIDRKRVAETAIGERVGWEPDWKLKLLMLKERRQQEATDARQKALARDPEYREKRAAIMRSAWSAGKFAGRKQAYLKKTTPRVERAKRLRAQGWTYQEIGEAIGITAYTAMRWLGWTRPPKGESKRSHPVTLNGVVYASEREASRETGVPRHRIRSRRGRPV